MSDVTVATGIDGQNENTENGSVEVQPETQAETKQDGRKTREKKAVYPVPSSKLQYPFQEGCEEWTLAYSKLSEEDFVDSESFEKWECEVYYEARIDAIYAKVDPVIRSLRQKQEAIRIKLEQSKAICESLNIQDESQKAAIADGLAMMSSATAAGVSMEQMLAAMQLLAAAKSEASEE